MLFDDDRWGQCTEAIVAKSEDEIIGIVTLAPKGIGNSKRPTIDTLYVQKQYRETGIGYSLFEQGIRRLIAYSDRLRHPIPIDPATLFRSNSPPDSDVLRHPLGASI